MKGMENCAFSVSCAKNYLLARFMIRMAQQQDKMLSFYMHLVPRFHSDSILLDWNNDGVARATSDQLAQNLQHCLSYLSLEFVQRDLS